ncbi:MAG: hypothetical protein RSD95_03730 [Clostridia bacterium]
MKNTRNALEFCEFSKIICDENRNGYHELDRNILFNGKEIGKITYSIENEEFENAEKVDPIDNVDKIEWNDMNLESRIETARQPDGIYEALLQSIEEDE